jgi:phosphoglycolate phosphatase-like HAD superfamily hydrolase
MSDSSAATKKCLLRTMSDTIETDIHRVHIIANEILPRYDKPKLSFEELRKVADGPFDLFLAPIIFDARYCRDPGIIYNEGVRREIRAHAIQIAHSHGFDVNPPDFIPGIESSLEEAQKAGLSNMVLTTSGRRYKHRLMEERGISTYFERIIDRDETYFRKEQGIYHLFRELNVERLEVILLSGTASYIKAGNNLEVATVAGNDLSVFTVALATNYSYNDEETLRAAEPKLLIHGLDELMPRLRKQGLIAQPKSAA